MLTVAGSWWQKPIDLEEAVRKYDRAYLNLAGVVMSEGRLPGDVELVGAHSCVFKGRRFGHVILKYRGQLVSILVTNIEAHDHPNSTEVKEATADAERRRLMSTQDLYVKL